MVDPRLLKDICAAESCSLIAYKDTNGFWTNGWGHLLDQHIDWTGCTITQATADSWRDHDIDTATHQAQALPEWSALDTVCRQNALVELMFNMGPRIWMQFHTTRPAMQNKNWPAVHNGLLNSAWAEEVHAMRANRIANYFLTGKYP